MAAPRLGAQVVRGALVREDTGTPIAGGVVTLVLERPTTTVDSTRADGRGRFLLRAPHPGLYRLYFASEGYATAPSDTFALAARDTVERRFAVPLLSTAAMESVGRTIDFEKRLQGDLTELCGERPRSWEAGLLVGTVRAREGGRPVAGAAVRVEAPARGGGAPFRRATRTSANGVFVVCNVPAGAATLRVEAPGFRPDTGAVEARAGAVGWFDIELETAAGAARDTSAARTCADGSAP